MIGENVLEFPYLPGGNISGCAGSNHDSAYHPSIEGDTYQLATDHSGPWPAGTYPLQSTGDTRNRGWNRHIRRCFHPEDTGTQGRSPLSSGRFASWDC